MSDPSENFTIVDEVNDEPDPDPETPSEEPESSVKVKDEVFHIEDDDDDDENPIQENYLESFENELDQLAKLQPVQEDESLKDDETAHETTTDNAETAQPELPDPQNTTRESEDGESENQKLDESVEEEAPEPHPYLYLIETFDYPKEQLNLSTVGAVKTLDETSYFLISSRTGLVKMLQNLRNQKVISLDVQVHKREAISLVCLIHISTPDIDYCIDAMRLKNDLLMLTEIFINPTIVKVVSHSKFLRFLQQNLHLYVVNIFDIEEAKAHLGENRHQSINVLIRDEFKYDRVPIKNPDYRRRPLPEDYKTYFRAGTHYLIYIYHHYKNKLILTDAEMYKKYLEECRNSSKIIHSEAKRSKFHNIEAEVRNRHNCELEVMEKLLKWRTDYSKAKNLNIDNLISKKGLLKLVKFLPVDESEIITLAPSQFVKKDMQNIKSLIQESCTKYKVFIPKIKKNSPPGKKPYTPPYTFNRGLPANKPQVPQGNKRKSNESYEQPKQKRPTHESFVQDNSQQRQNQNRNRNRKRGKFNPPPPPPTFNNMSKDPESLLKFNHSKRQNFSQVNPTNVPSSFTFQAPNNSNSGRNNYDNNINNQNNFSQSSTQMRLPADPNDDVLYRSLMDLREVRDNLRIQGRSNYHDLTDIDKKIINLEKRVMLRQGGVRRGSNQTNNYNDEGHIYNKRRY